MFSRRSSVLRKLVRSTDNSERDAGCYTWWQWVEFHDKSLHQYKCYYSAKHCSCCFFILCEKIIIIHLAALHLCFWQVLLSTATCIVFKVRIWSVHAFPENQTHELELLAPCSTFELQEGYLTHYYIIFVSLYYWFYCLLIYVRQ